MASPLTRHRLTAGLDDDDIYEPGMLEDYLRDIGHSGIASLLNGVADTRLIKNNQDQTLADIFETSSSIALPIGTNESNFICGAPDILAYYVKDSKNSIQLEYNCSEINGTGFGGLLSSPINQLETILKTYRCSARRIKEECIKNGEYPLIIVGNSGREDVERINGEYPISGNSHTFGEKLFIVDEFIDEVDSLTNPCQIDSIDTTAIPYYKQTDLAKFNFDMGVINKDEYNKEIKNAYANSKILMKKYFNKPTVLLGYVKDISTLCKIKHGIPYFFGRQVNGFFNDRAASNLSKKENKKINYKKAHIMNVNFKEGNDKFSLTLARDKFHTSTEAKLLPTLARDRGFIYDVCGLDKSYHFQSSQEDLALISDMNNNDLDAYRMRYFRGITKKDGINGIMKALDDFKKLRMKPLFKPSGTSRSMGIIAYKTGEANEDFKQRFNENLNKIKKEFEEGAGYPFCVMPVLNLAKTIKGEVYDLRFVIYRKVNCTGNFTIHTIPLFIKTGLQQIKRESMENDEFFPTNVTLSILKTGRPFSDFTIPFCSEDSIKQVNLTVDQVKSMCLYLSAFQCWLLKTKYLF